MGSANANDTDWERDCRGETRRTARERRRNAWRRALLASTMLVGVGMLRAPSAFCNPSGGQVVGGSATITQAPGTTTIDQGSARAIIDWRSFSIDGNETTRFNQPGRDAIALNRVRGGDASNIQGRLQANGHVWLVNPNGVLIGPNARVDVGGFFATTSDILNEEFMAGRYRFSIPSPNGEAKVVNEGTISIAEGGLAGLVAPHVRNDGVIQGTLSEVVVAGVPTFALDFRGDGLIGFEATSAVTQVADRSDPLVVNTGTIAADGGHVLLTANAAADVVDRAINMTGVISARIVAQRGGTIVLDGGGDGAVTVAGTLDASGRDEGERGGHVKLLSERVGLFDGTNIDVSGDAGGGEVLVGGNYQGKGPEPNATLTYVDENSRIAADAGRSGDGGRVIVWSDKATINNGTISARGGTRGGNGGFVEVSGKANLAFNGVVDVSAPAGQAGAVLFDPANIAISETLPPGGYTLADAALDPDAFINFDETIPDATGNFQITPGELAILAANTGDIRLQATDSIQVLSSAVLLNVTSGETFSLQAGGSISINTNSPIGILTGGGNVHLEADSPHTPGTPGGADGFGTITINAPLATNGGNVALIYSGSLSVNAPIQAGTGSVSDAPSRDGVSGTIIDLGLFRNITAAILIDGQATTRGPNGDGVGALLRTFGSTAVDNTFEVAPGISKIILVNLDGFAVASAQALTFRQPVTINADADGDGVGTITTGDGASVHLNGDFHIIAGNGIDIRTTNLGRVAAQTTTGNIQLRNSGGSAVSVSQLGATSGLRTQEGAAFVLNSDGRITLDAPISATGTRDSIILVGNAFTNNVGSSALQPGSGRFLVYSVDPTNDAIRGLTGALLFNSSYATAPPSSATLAPTSNYFIYTSSPSAITELVPPSVFNPVVPSSNPAAAGAQQTESATLLTFAVPALPGMGGAQEEKNLLYSNDGNQQLWGLLPPPSPPTER